MCRYVGGCGGWRSGCLEVRDAVLCSAVWMGLESRAFY